MFTNYTHTHTQTHTNTHIYILDSYLGKGMNPIILPLGMDVIVGQTGFFSLGEATSLGEGKLWIQTC